MSIAALAANPLAPVWAGLIRVLIVIQPMAEMSGVLRLRTILLRSNMAPQTLPDLRTETESRSFAGQNLPLLSNRPRFAEDFTSYQGVVSVRPVSKGQLFSRCR